MNAIRGVGLLVLTSTLYACGPYNVPLDAAHPYFYDYTYPAYIYYYPNYYDSPSFYNTYSF